MESKTPQSPTEWKLFSHILIFFLGPQILTPAPVACDLFHKISQCIFSDQNYEVSSCWITKFHKYESETTSKSNLVETFLAYTVFFPYTQYFDPCPSCLWFLFRGKSGRLNVIAAGNNLDRWNKMLTAGQTESQVYWYWILGLDHSLHIQWYGMWLREVSNMIDKILEQCTLEKWPFGPNFSMFSEILI